jgi:hypothetical protein
MHLALQNLWGSNHRNDIHIQAHSATPFVKFLLQAARSNRTAARAIHKAGFVDMLVCMCNSKFPDSRIPTADTSRWLATTSLLDVCISTLEALSVYPNIQRKLSTSMYALAEVWPKNQSRNIIRLKPMPAAFEPLRHRRSSCLRRLRELSAAPPESIHSTCADSFYLSRFV